MNMEALGHMGDGEVIGNQDDLDLMAARLQLPSQIENGRLEYELDLIRRIYSACNLDRDWFLAHPERKTRIRPLTELEAHRDFPRKHHAMQDARDTHLVVVDRIRPFDGCLFLGYEAITETEAQGNVVIIAEPFQVYESRIELPILERMEEVIGSEMFDKVVGAWLASHVRNTRQMRVPTHEKEHKIKLHYDSLFAIAERICPGHIQAVRPNLNGTPLA